MHTIESCGRRIHLNPDLSGDVTIIDKQQHAIDIPGEVFIDVVAYFVRAARISQIEQVDNRYLLTRVVDSLV